MVDIQHSIENILQVNDYRLEPCQLYRVRYILRKAFLASKETGLEPKQFEIVDFGCGTGNISIALSQCGFKVVGFDIDRNNIEHAVSKSKNLSNSPDFLLAEAADLGSRKFNFVVCSEVLEHTDGPENILEQLKQLTEENGEICLTIPNGYGFSEWLGLKRFLFTRKIKLNLLKKLRYAFSKYRHQSMLNRDNPHCQWWTLKKFKRFIEKMEFEIAEQKAGCFCFPFLYVVFLCFFIRPGSLLFKWFERLDLYLADKVPLSWAAGWFFILKNGRAKNIRTGVTAGEMKEKT